MGSSSCSPSYAEILQVYHTNNQTLALWQLQVKIADFGLTCLVDSGPEKTAEIGTYRWMAPEVIAHENSKP